MRRNRAGGFIDWGGWWLLSGMFGVVVLAIWLGALLGSDASACRQDHLRVATGAATYVIDADGEVVFKMLEKKITPAKPMIMVSMIIIWSTSTSTSLCF